MVLKHNNNSLRKSLQSLCPGFYLSNSNERDSMEERMVFQARAGILEKQRQPKRVFRCSCKETQYLRAQRLGKNDYSTDIGSRRKLYSKYLWKITLQDSKVSLSK